MEIGSYYTNGNKIVKITAVLQNHYFDNKYTDLVIFETRANLIGVLEISEFNKLYKSISEENTNTLKECKGTYLTKKQLLFFLQNPDISDDTPIVVQRLEDKFYDEEINQKVCKTIKMVNNNKTITEYAPVLCICERDDEFIYLDIS
jgi:hypothetical protein